VSGTVETIDLTVLERELLFRFSRSSGPGGQNVNKVNSKVTLIWTPAATGVLKPGAKRRFLDRYGNRLSAAGELQISSDRFRDQRRNREDCLEKLGSMIEPILKEPKRRRKTKPSKGAVERRLAGKKHRSQRKSSRRFSGSD